MKKILVTGGAGYIGSVLVQKLLQKDFEVTVVDNFFYNQLSLNHLCEYKSLKIYNGDVRDVNIMKELVKKHDVIVPLAAIVGAPACKKDPVGSSSVNKDSVLMLLSIKAKDQVIIMPTTNSAYGKGNNNNLCDEDTILNPISKYAIDKVDIEKKLSETENFISLRLATVFGMSPRMRLDLLVNDFVYRACTDNFVVLYESHFKRNYVHVSDVSDLIVFCIAKYDKMKNNIYNVGLSDANISKLQLCERIKKHIPKFKIIQDNYEKDDDQRNYVVSNKKIEATGFQFKKSLDEGILELIKGYNSFKKYSYGNV
jgi:nucleoside-diphosphate-sugar epimerase